MQSAPHVGGGMQGAGADEIGEGLSEQPRSKRCQVTRSCITGAAIMM